MILVTGTSGFIGSRLLKALAIEYGKDNILALTSQTISGQKHLIHNDYTFNDDFLLNSEFNDIHTIIHAGAFIPKNRTEADDWIKSNRNVITTDRLLKLKIPKLKKIIYLSTIDVYGNDEIVSESSPIAPVSVYAFSKLYCEKIVETFATRKNIKHQILRIGHVYGPGEESFQKIIPITMKKLIKGEILEIWGSGLEIRTFIYVDDVVKAIQKSVHLKESTEPINLVGGRNIDINSLINQIVAISETNPKISKRELNSSPRDLIFNNSRMEIILGKETVTLEMGLRNEWEYMRSIVL